MPIGVSEDEPAPATRNARRDAGDDNGYFCLSVLLGVLLPGVDVLLDVSPEELLPDVPPDVLLSDAPPALGVLVEPEVLPGVLPEVPLEASEDEDGGVLLPEDGDELEPADDEELGEDGAVLELPGLLELPLEVAPGVLPMELPPVVPLEDDEAPVELSPAPCWSPHPYSPPTATARGMRANADFLINFMSVPLLGLSGYGLVASFGPPPARQPAPYSHHVMT